MGLYRGSNFLILPGVWERELVSVAALSRVHEEFVEIPLRPRGVVNGL